MEMVRGTGIISKHPAGHTWKIRWNGHLEPGKMLGMRPVCVCVGLGHECGFIYTIKEYGVPMLTRAPTGGGGYPPPRRFFVDNGKTAKFGMTIPSSFLHIMCKL